MQSRRSLPARSALLLAALGLGAAACGTHSGGSTAAGATNTAPHAALVSMASVDGTSVLASADGHTLYDATIESPRHVLCVDACTNFWRPVLASAAQAHQAGTMLGKQFTVVHRPGGQTQLTYAGHPLYTFTAEGPHQLRGNGFHDEFGGTHFAWSAAGGTGSSHPQPAAPTSGSGGGYGGSGGYGGGY